MFKTGLLFITLSTATVPAAPAAEREPFLFTTFKIETEQFQASCMILNESAADSTLDKFSVSQSFNFRRSYIKHTVEAKTGFPVMLFTLFIRSEDTSQSPVDVPGPLKFAVTRGDEVFPSLGVTHPVRIWPGRWDITFIIFKKFPLLETDTITVRAGEQ